MEGSKMKKVLLKDIVIPKGIVFYRFEGIGK